MMTWRAWRPLSPVPDGVCGARGDDGPTPGGAGPTLQSLLAQVGGSGSVAPERGGNPGECTGALGPFPFADGSLQALSSRRDPPRSAQTRRDPPRSAESPPHIGLGAVVMNYGPSSLST